MESNHPRNVTPRNSVLKTGEATGPHPPPQSDFADLARCLLRVQVRLPTVCQRLCSKFPLPLPAVSQEVVPRQVKTGFSRGRSGTRTYYSKRSLCPTYAKWYVSGVTTSWTDS